MAIDSNSRYANYSIENLTYDGVSRATIIITPPSANSTITFTTYVWKSGDFIEYLAYSAYGDPTSWWVIANANPQILFWSTITPGTNIRVPTVS